MASQEIVRNNGRTFTIKEDYNRVFSPKEWKIFFKNLKKKQKISCDILLNTGARINEARNVKVKDINFKDKEILLTATKKRKNLISPPRLIKISSQFSNRLKKYCKGLKKEDYIPILSNPALNTAYKKAGMRAGIKNYGDISSHTFRKTLETWLYCLQVDSRILFKHFGHQPTIAFERYIANINYNYNDKKDMRKLLGDLHFIN